MPYNGDLGELSKRVGMAEVLLDTLKKHSVCRAQSAGREETHSAQEFQQQSDSTTIMTPNKKHTIDLLIDVRILRCCVGCLSWPPT